MHKWEKSRAGGLSPSRSGEFILKGTPFWRPSPLLSSLSGRQRQSHFSHLPDDWCTKPWISPSHAPPRRNRQCHNHSFALLPLIVPSQSSSSGGGGGGGGLYQQKESRSYNVEIAQERGNTRCFRETGLLQLNISKGTPMKYSSLIFPKSGPEVQMVPQTSFPLV